MVDTIGNVISMFPQVAQDRLRPEYEGITACPTDADKTFQVLHLCTLMAHTNNVLDRVFAGESLSQYFTPDYLRSIGMTDESSVARTRAVKDLLNDYEHLTGIPIRY